MSSRDVECPARVTGIIPGCRFCVWLAGSSSELCIKMKAQYERKKMTQSEFDAKWEYIEHKNNRQHLQEINELFLKIDKCHARWNKVKVDRVAEKHAEAERLGFESV